MSELTPIPAEHRKVYYDALLAGRAEAERLGYPMLDDRIFAAFDRAQRGPLAELIVATTRRQVAEELRAEAARLDLADDPFALDIALAAHWLTDRNAAIARGRGETPQPPTH